MELHGDLNRELYVLAGAGALLVLQLTFTALYWLQRRSIRRIDGRVGHLSAAVALLTDTMEGGLQDVAREVARMSAPVAAPPKSRTATQRRVRGAARRGRSVRDIAANEEMSEGEVRLMLQMPGREGKENARHAEMR